MVVTLLTCGSALGIGPGAASGETSPAQPSTATPAPPVGGSPGTHPASQSSDDWVTVTDSPTHPAKHIANPGGRDSTPGTRDSTPGNGPAALGVPAHSGHGKRVVYDITAQRVWLVRASGDVARTYLVSGSRNPQLLDPGTYAVYSKSRNAVSFDSKETMNYMVRFASGKRSAIGFHDIPALDNGTLVESRSELGTPQSAGCIRQWITDAKALWEFAAVGTTVVVTA